MHRSAVMFATQLDPMESYVLDCRVAFCNPPNAFYHRLLIPWTLSDTTVLPPEAHRIYARRVTVTIDVQTATPVTGDLY